MESPFLKDLLVLLGAGCLLATVWFGANKQLRAAFVAMGAGVFLIGFALFERIDSIRVEWEGIEVRTRETLVETESTLAAIRRLAAITAQTTLTNAQLSGRSAPISDDEQEKIHNETIALLDDLGFTDDEIKEIRATWQIFVEWDYMYFMLGGHFRPSEWSEEARNERNLFIMADIDERPSPDVLEEYFARHGLMTPDREELITDFRYYVEHGEHRRPDVWRNRKNWVPKEKPDDSD